MIKENKLIVAPLNEYKEIALLSELSRLFDAAAQFHSVKYIGTGATQKVSLPFTPEVVVIARAFNMIDPASAPLPASVALSFRASSPATYDLASSMAAFDAVIAYGNQAITLGSGGLVNTAKTPYFMFVIG
jgi:hypothetical protein